MSQAEEAEMNGKVGHIKQRIVLAKLIEIQAGELRAVNHQMFGREVTVGRTLGPA